MIRRFTEFALSWPSAFAAYQALIGAPDCHRRFITDYVAATQGERVLDIGCGVGASVRFIPSGVEYVGVDVSRQYIDAAQRAFGDRGSFVCADLRDEKCRSLGAFDKAFAFGVLHHLPDGAVEALSQLLSRVVRPGGTFVSIDPCRHQNQPLWAKVMMDLDRGRYIRTEAGYSQVLSSPGRATTELRLDMLNIRYAMAICRLTVGNGRRLPRGCASEVRNRPA